MANKTLNKLTPVADVNINTLLAGANTDGVLGSITVTNLSAVLNVSAAVALKGVAVPTTDPGTPAQPEYYQFSTAGTYAHFPGSGGVAIVVNAGEAGNLVYNGSAWTKVTIPVDLSGYLPVDSLELETGAQLFDKAAMIPDYYVPSDGSLHTAAGWKAAEIPVSDSFAQLTISGYTFAGSPNKYTIFVDSDNTIIGSTVAIVTNTRTLNIPAGAVKLRMSVLRAGEADTVADTIMINYGATALPYELYATAITAIDGSPIKNADIDVYGKAETYAKTEVYNKTETDLLLPQLTLSPGGKNIFNPERVLNGLVSSSADGGINPDSNGWKAVTLAVSDNQQYTISGWASVRTEIGFYSGALPAAGVAPLKVGLIHSGSAASLGFTKAGGTCTIVTPNGCTYIGVTIKTNTEPASVYDTLQIEIGPVATTYEPYSDTEIVSEINTHGLLAKYVDINGVTVSTDDLITNNDGSSGADSAIALTLNVEGAGNTILEYKADGRNMREEIVPYRPLSPDESTVLDFRKTYIDDVLVHSLVDDVAPYRIAGTTIGANHGYSKTRLTISAHGKTNVDVGSVWSDGSSQWVIVNIADVDNIDVSKRTGNVGYVGTTLTHVSGATHTTSITGQTATTARQMYPAFNNRIIRLLIDGVEVNQESKKYVANTSVTFAESYDILSKDSIVEWLITQVGTGTKILQYGGTPIASVNINYVLNRGGGWTIYTDLLARAVTGLQDIMFNMNNKLTVSAEHPVMKFYVPHTLPFNFQSIDWDLTQPTDMSGVTLATRMQFIPERVEAAGIYADRALMLMDSVGYVLGLIPVRDAAIVDRRTNASRKALEISESQKIYLSTIDRADKTALAEGDYFSAIAYKKYFVSNADRSAGYSVKTNVGTYLYADWHTTGTKRLDIPVDCMGKDYTIIQKAGSLTVLTSAMGNIIVEIDSTENYAYLILKFD